MNPEYWLWLYNKALIDQLVRSILENIWTLALRTDFTSLAGVCTLKLRSKYFPAGTSQLVNKSIVLKVSWPFGCPGTSFFQGVFCNFFSLLVSFLFNVKFLFFLQSTCSVIKNSILNSITVTVNGNHQPWIAIKPQWMYCTWPTVAFTCVTFKTFKQDATDDRSLLMPPEEQKKHHKNQSFSHGEWFPLSMVYPKVWKGSAFVSYKRSVPNMQLH